MNTCPYTVPRSSAGAQRHEWRGESACPACTAARRDYQRSHDLRQRDGLPHRSWPAEPLLETLNRRDLPQTHFGATIAKAIERGQLATTRADQAAVTLGLHPCEIWPDWFDRTEVST